MIDPPATAIGTDTYPTFVIKHHFIKEQKRDGKKGQVL